MKPSRVNKKYLTDKKLKEAAQKEQSLNRHVPLESFFPNSKQYPEGHKFLMNSLKENGFQLNDPEGIPSMKVRDLIEFKKIFDMKKEMKDGPVLHLEKEEPIVTALPQKRDDLTTPAPEDDEAWGAIPSFLRRHKK